MQRLHKLHRLHIHRTHLLSLRLYALLCNVLLRIHKLRLPVLVLSSESDLELRVLVVAERHKV